MANKSPLVFIILVNWNGSADTIRCIDSLRSLEYDNFHVLCVDNGSTDTSVGAIRSACPDIELIESGHNYGFAGGNNIGIELALDKQADFIWLLNNDTLVSPTSLSEMVATAVRHQEYGVIGSKILCLREGYVKSENIQALGGGVINFRLGNSCPIQLSDDLPRLQYITGASLLVKKNVFKKVGGIDDKFFMYWEDVDFCFRVRKAGWLLGVAENAIIWHKESASLGKSNPVLDDYFSSSAVLFFKRHSPQWEVPILVGACGRLLKRLFKLEFSKASAVIRGTFRGFSIADA